MVTSSVPAPLYKQLLPLPNPILRYFWNDFLMTPTPSTPIQASFTVTPSSSTTPAPPLKKFDRHQGIWNVLSERVLLEPQWYASSFADASGGRSLTDEDNDRREIMSTLRYCRKLQQIYAQ